MKSMFRASTLSFALLCVLICVPIRTEAAPILVETYRQDPAHTTFSFLRILHADATHPLQSAGMQESTPILPRSHVRIRYASKNPLPVRIVFPWDPASHHQLTAVLPASDSGDALLDLTHSPAWRQTMPVLSIDVYWVGETEPVITSVEVENHVSLLQTWIIYLRQPFMREGFSSFSLGTIYGYKIAGRSFTLVAGLVMVLAIVLFYAYSRKRSLLFVAIAMWVPVLLLYESRFVFDIASATVSDQYEWWSDGQYNDMRFLYATADVIQKEHDRTHDVSSVAVCTGLATPLRYFLFPIPTGDAKMWSGATIGVLHSVWNDDQKEFSCGGVKRAGTLLHLFPNGEAVVRLSDVPQP